MNHTYIACGLGFGDEGKGTIVDYLARLLNASAVVRFNGGPQAAHNVVLSNGFSHCFSMFGSGTFHPGTKTHLSSQTLIKIQGIITEGEALTVKGVPDLYDHLSIDPTCHLVMPFHAMLGQILEVARGENRFGSVGLGVGQAVLDRQRKGEKAIRFIDIFDKAKFRRKAKELWHEKANEYLRIIKETGDKVVLDRYQVWADFIDFEEIIYNHLQFAKDHPHCAKTDQEFFGSNSGKFIFEGSQGTLLDVDFGFYPYVTKTRTLAREGDRLLQENGVSGKVTKIGILRAYGTRHGAGPFPTESQEVRELISEPHNTDCPWQGSFRSGWFDLLLARYAVEINGDIDCLAITHLDSLEKLGTVRLCRTYQYTGSHDDLDKFFEWEKKGNKIQINRIIPPNAPTPKHQAELAKHLFRCTPLDFGEFPLWQNTTFDKNNLPEELTSYLNFLESKEGLGLPVSIISFGPTAKDKINLRPL